MLDLEPLYRLVSLFPFECLQAGFMQQALVALILLAPMAATMGVQVVSFRMAFFSDAISHSAFAGVALGLIFSINPHVAMPVFGILVGLGIMAVQRNSALSSDTIIGVFFSAVMAFGLAVVSRDNAVARDLQQFLYGDILTDEAAQLRGGVGTAGSANIGTRYAMFDAIHGTVPRLIAEGKGDYANPTTILRAAAMLLR